MIVKTLKVFRPEKSTRKSRSLLLNNPAVKDVQWFVIENIHQPEVTFLTLIGYKLQTTKLKSGS